MTVLELALVFVIIGAIVASVVRSLSEPVGAQIEVAFEEGGANRFDWIVLRNEGDRTAEKVYLTLDADGAANPVKTSTRQKLPTTLGPGDVQRLQAVTHAGSQPPYHVTTTWLEDGEQKERRETIDRS